MRSFVWLVAGVGRMAPGICGLWLVSSVVSGALIPAQLWLTKTLVDALAARLQGLAEPQIGVWVALLAAVIVAERVNQGGVAWLAAELREQAGTAARDVVMCRAAALPAGVFEDQKYYDRLNQVMGPVEVRMPAAVGHLMQLVRTLPQLAGYAVGLFTVAPLLLGLVLVAWAPAMIVFFVSGKSHMGLLREQTRERRLAEYYEGYLRWRVSAKEVRLYQLRNYLLGRWETLYWETRNAQRALALRLGLKQQGAALVSETVGVFGMVWVVAAGLARATPGAYAVLFQSLSGTVSSLFSLANAAKVLGELAEYARDYRAFAELPTETAALDGDVSAGGPEHAASRPDGASNSQRQFPERLSEGIRFEDVWFTYPGSDRPALAGVSFELRPGERIALVGENGAGKTTLVKLLLGLYRPDAGRITIDGVDAQEIDLRSRRRAMSAVFQLFTHYQLTLAENVALGQPERAADRVRIQEAARLAGADEFVPSLPAGYDTVLGPDVGGVDLSGGQWQRVAAARAFFREAQVLVLDEPTAALDPLAELAVFERFVRLAEGKTAVLISHRLGMARLADRVVVLRDGRVAEEGPHAALVRAGGEYAALFGAQARWYA